MKWEKASEIAEKLKFELSYGCARLEIVGSVKRHDKEEVHDIEILCIANMNVPRPEFGRPKVYKNMLEKIIAYMQYKEFISQPVKDGDKYKQMGILGTGESPFYLDLFIVQPETWGIQNVIRTGPSEFSHRFVTNKAFGGLLPDHLEYLRGETKIRVIGSMSVLDLPEEKDAIALIGKGWIEPKNRRVFAMTNVT